MGYKLWATIRGYFLWYTKCCEHIPEHFHKLLGGCFFWKIVHWYPSRKPVFWIYAPCRYAPMISCLHILCPVWICLHDFMPPWILCLHSLCPHYFMPPCILCLHVFYASMTFMPPCILCLHVFYATMYFMPPWHLCLYVYFASMHFWLLYTSNNRHFYK